MQRLPPREVPREVFQPPAVPVSRSKAWRPPQWEATNERRESWRPPLFRPTSQEPSGAGPRSQRRPPERAPRRQRDDPAWERERPGRQPRERPLREAPPRERPRRERPDRVPREGQLSEAAAPSAAPAPSEERSGGLLPTPVSGVPRLNLYQLSSEELEDFVVGELELPKFRAKQLRDWLYKFGVPSFARMKNLPRPLRQTLASKATIGAEDWAVLAERQSTDGTLKRAYGVPGNHAIESVLMPYNDGRQTACISTQVGCAMGCVFCATGQMGFKRHLTAAEIFEQAARFSASLKQQRKRLSRIVLMGMGEPLANYDNVVSAIRRIQADLEIGWRHITISTVGLVPEIRRLAAEGMQVKLAISLHAATDEERSALLPMNRRYPISTVMDAARYYFEATGRRVTFEWALIEGENDDVATAQRLGRLLANGVPGSHVNLIPVNPTKGFGGRPTGREAAARFVETLSTFGIEATMRVRRGIDIDAGCGQLAERAAAEYEEYKQDEPAGRETSGAAQLGAEASEGGSVDAAVEVGAVAA